MKVNCLSCGHKVDLDEVYDDYNGQVKCFACRALLEIKTHLGQLKTINIVNSVSALAVEDVQGFKGSEVQGSEVNLASGPEGL
ncbi:MAG: hypothetical protein WBY47_05785 [Desulfobacterales bacterium]|jgi:ribosomal protein S27E